MYLRVCQNLELIHIFSVFSQKILKRKKIKQHPFNCNTKCNPPYGQYFQFGPNWVSRPEKKNEKQVRGEFFGGMCKHSTGTRALHSYQCSMGFYSYPSMPLCMYLAWGLLLILFSAPWAFSPGALANPFFPKTNIYFIKLKSMVEKEPH